MLEMNVTSMLISEMLQWKKCVLKSEYDIITKLTVLIFKNKTNMSNTVK